MDIPKGKKQLHLCPASQWVQPAQWGTTQLVWHSGEWSGHTCRRTQKGTGLCFEESAQLDYILALRSYSFLSQAFPSPPMASAHSQAPKGWKPQMGHSLWRKSKRKVNGRMDRSYIRTDLKKKKEVTSYKQTNSILGSYNKNVYAPPVYCPCLIYIIFQELHNCNLINHWIARQKLHYM